MKRPVRAKDFVDASEQDYLLSCLESTPKQRLEWLEAAHDFVKSVHFGKKVKKRLK